MSEETQVKTPESETEETAVATVEEDTAEERTTIADDEEEAANAVAALDDDDDDDYDDDDDDDYDDDDYDDDDDVTISRVDGPANFNRAKEGGRRNPRYVGDDVRLDEISYKNVQILSRFVDNHGRIYNRRKTRVSAKMQRKVTRAIKRARHLALMPYTGEHIRVTRRRRS